jgi:hypothetical protein
MKKLLFLSIAALLCALVACKKTQEGETSAWKYNQDKIAELKADYPAFRQVLDEQLSRAQGVWANAEKIGSAEEKIKQMAAANKMLRSGFIYDLGDVTTKRKAIERKIKELANKRMDSAAQQEATRAINRANDMLYQVNRNLGMSVGSEQSAMRVSQDAKNTLSNAERGLDSAIKLATNKNTPNNNQKQGDDNRKPDNSRSTETTAPPR